MDAFVTAPSAEGLRACQTRGPARAPVYGQCEVSRFYNGPIDAAQGGMNEWPIDESFIDYTPRTPDGGIVNAPTTYPQITAQVLATADEKGEPRTCRRGFMPSSSCSGGARRINHRGRAHVPAIDYARSTGTSKERSALRTISRR